MRNISELQMRVLREEFPQLSFDTDPDIERYFELWKSGQHKEALALYNAKIRRKFPDDAARAELLRCYRSRDPRFKRLLYESIATLAEKLEKRVRYVISVLTDRIGEVDVADAYSVIRYAENLLSMISSDRMKAIPFTEKYARYAAFMDYRAGDMRRTADLIRMYVTDSIESVLDLRRQRRARRIPARQKAAAPAAVDFSQITFSAEDVSKILIPQNIQRVEDSVIAYCLKYWNRVSDPAFERIVVLYSKKYRTKHSDIFFAVKNGRLHGWKDEEILNAVLSTVVSGYYYNISGDLYLQRAWRYYKSSVGLEPAAPEAEENPPAAKPAASSRARRKSASPARRTENARKVAASRKGAGKPEQDGKPAKPAETAKPAEARKPGRPARMAKTAAPARKSTAAVSAPGRSTALAGEKTKKEGIRKQTGARPVQPEAAAKKAAKPVRRRRAAALSLENGAEKFVPNSVADIIKRVSGETYTVYRELFFQEVRPAIREELTACYGKKGIRLFASKHQNEAEEILFNYLLSHYDDPYQDWSSSVEKKSLVTLGYNLESIHKIVERWYRSRKKR